MSDPVRILECQETFFFSYLDAQLRQWVMVTAENRGDKSERAEVRIVAGNQTASTFVQLQPGIYTYRCFAPTFWPDQPPKKQAFVQLSAAEVTVIAPFSLGNHRPWTAYLLSDICTDYTWVYPDAAELHRDDAAVTAAEMMLVAATRDNQEIDRNHYNFVHAREVEFFLEQYPEQAEELFDAICQGNLTLNPIYTMCLTADMSLEELIRQFYPARFWAQQYGLDIGCANHQETPTITWAMSTVLAGIGARHLVKSILPYECPWAERLEEPPVFFWEGPDGSRILVRRRNQDYVEGNFVLKGLEATCKALHEGILQRYIALGETYLFDAIALVGSYGDLSPDSRNLPAKKVAAVTAYNAQEWDFPRLVNASHKQFWDDVDAQMTKRALAVPVFRGDYGTSWDAWPASLAHDFSRWRRAQAHASTADVLAALLTRISPEWYVEHGTMLQEGWRHLRFLADHAWNGANDANRKLNAALRRQWQTAANTAFDSVVAAGVQELGRHIPTSSSQQFAVFNTLGWVRSGLVRVPDATPVAAVVDRSTGEKLPVQLVEDKGHHDLVFVARSVPAVGYKVFDVVEQKHHKKRNEARITYQILPDATILDAPFYILQVSHKTGGITSLFDKIRGKELVSTHHNNDLNQCLYWSDGVEYTPESAVVEVGKCGPVYGELIIRTSFHSINLTTTITLYAELDCVDIRNEIEKTPTWEKQELDFIFPFQVPDRQIRYEAPGAVIDPAFDLRPGAGQAVTAVQQFVDIFNTDYGVTFSQADAGLVMFGHRTSQEDPREPDSDSTVISLAMENCIDWDEAVRDQAGVTHFVFRYRLCSHNGGFDPVRAVRFGWENNRELLLAHLQPGQQSQLPEDIHSFLKITPDEAVLLTFKAAEESGLIMRLWEVSGNEVSAAVAVSGMGTLRSAYQTDLLELNDREIPVCDNETRVTLSERAVCTLRLI